MDHILMQQVVAGVAAVTVVLSAALFIVKITHQRHMSSRAERRTRYVDVVGEMLADMHILDEDVRRWGRDPAFEDVLLEYMAVVAGDERDLLHRLAIESGLRARLIRGAQRGWSRERRAHAAGHLASLADPATAPVLRVLLVDRVAEVRLHAAHGLALIGEIEAAPQVVARMTSETPWTAARMADALVVFGPDAVPALCDQLMGQDLPVHTTALVVRSLGLIGDLRAEPTLLAFLSSRDAELRIAACSAIGKSGSPASVPPLIRALGDEDWRVRARAAAALGGLADPRAVQPLYDVLSDRAWWVRQNAAEALAQLPGGLGTLAAAGNHDDPYARDAASLQLALAGARGGR